MLAPKVYIVVLNYNGWKDTLGCLDSLLQLDYDDYMIVVVDNASTDESEEKIAEWRNTKDSALVKYIQAGKNSGFAGGNNVGIKYVMTNSDAKYIWLLNNDTIVDSKALSKLVEVMESNHKIGICGSKLVYDWDRSRVQGYGAIYNKYTGNNISITNYNEIDKMDYVIGASMMVSRAFIEEIGLLSEEYFLYYEELDWALRAKSRYKLACAPGSIVFHKQGASIGGNTVHVMARSKLSDYYSVRNRILFTKKHYPWCLPTIYLGLVVAIINRICRGQWDRVGMIIRLMINQKVLYDGH